MLLPIEPSPQEQADGIALAARIRTAAPEAQAGLLAELAGEIRRSIVGTIAGAGMGHVGGDLSVTDILTVLYFSVLSLDPVAPLAPARDRFVLSKGHCAAALYTVLARRGFISATALPSFMRNLSLLNGHPNRRKIPGVEANTGPLGHGLPIAVGMATAARITGGDWLVFVVTGDGELQEGSNWEAAMAAGHRGLDNLTLIVDRNRLQQGAGTEETNRLEPLADKFRAFGFDVTDLDGHDHAALQATLVARGQGRPRCVIARTLKGKGVSFMENRSEWHHKVPSPQQTEAALAELAS